MNIEKKQKEKFDLGVRLLLVSGIVCILLKLLNLCFFPWPNLVLAFFVVPFTFLLTIVIVIIRRKGLLKNGKMILATAFCMIATVVAIVLPQTQLDITKYFLSKNAYLIAAEQIAEEISTMEDTLTGEYEPNNEFSKLSSDGKIRYLKSGNNIIVNFTSSASRVFVGGFAYFKGDNAHELLENPGKYDERFTEQKICESYQVLDGTQWAYVEWF